MSFFDSIPQIDFASRQSLDRTLSWRHLADYGQLLEWILWQPNELTYYVHTHSAETSPDFDEESLPDYVDDKSAGRHSALNDLSILSLFLAIILCVLACIGYWISLIILSFSTEYIVASFDNFLVGTLSGVASVTIIYYGYRLLATQARDKEDVVTALTVITGSLIGMSIGFLLIDPRILRSAMSLILLGSAAGIILGLLSSTVAYYLADENGQAKFILQGIGILIVVLFTLMLVARDFGILLLSILATLSFFTLAALRIDDWVLGQMQKRQALKERNINLLPRVTLLPIVGLRYELEEWLEWDWENGLENIKEIRKYTRQDPMTTLAIQQILKELSDSKSEALVSNIEYLQETFDKTDLRIFSPSKMSRPLYYNIIRPIIKQSIWPLKKGEKPKKSRQERRQELRRLRTVREQSRLLLSGDYPTESLAEAAIAGYSFLKLNYPEKAAEAFKKVEYSPLGKEMSYISTAIAKLWFTEKLPEKIPLDLPKKPEKPKHPKTWESFARFQEIVRLVWLLQRAHIRMVGAREIDHHPEIKQLLDVKFTELYEGLPSSVEGEALRLIAADWQIEINLLADTVGKFERVSPIENPFVFAEPLSEKNSDVFYGRKTQLAQIKAAWRVGNFQPLLIHGQRRMGKTSLVRYARAQHSKLIRMAYVNLRQLELEDSPIPLFLTICDAVSELRIHPPPTTESLTAAPYREFSQYIHNCSTQLGSTGLVIVLDELEHLIFNSQLFDVLKESIQQLWTLSQLEPNVGLLLLTARNPGELINENNEKLLTTPIQPVNVGYLSKEDVTSLLRNPTPNFLPYCTDEAIEQIIRLTAGQPYITQLLAYYLVERYNSEVEATNGQRAPIFSRTDVEYAIGARQTGNVLDPQQQAFRRLCERYFVDILSEARQAIGADTKRLLIAIAKQRRGITLRALSDSIGSEVAESDLHRLSQHGILERDEEKWRIIIRLFSAWLRHLADT